MQLSESNSELCINQGSNLDVYICIIILLMEEFLHQLIGSLSHYFRVFYIPGGAGFQPSTDINSMYLKFVHTCSKLVKSSKKNTCNVLFIFQSAIDTIHLSIQAESKEHRCSEKNTFLTIRQTTGRQSPLDDDLIC